MLGRLELLFYKLPEYHDSSDEKDNDEDDGRDDDDGNAVERVVEQGLVVADDGWITGFELGQDVGYGRLRVAVFEILEPWGPRRWGQVENGGSAALAVPAAVAEQ